MALSLMYYAALPLCCCILIEIFCSRWGRSLFHTDRDHLDGQREILRERHNMVLQLLVIGVVVGLALLLIFFVNQLLHMGSDPIIT